jgi:hypothetical protein
VRFVFSFFNVIDLGRPFVEHPLPADIVHRDLLFVSRCLLLFSVVLLRRFLLLIFRFLLSYSFGCVLESITPQHVQQCDSFCMDQLLPASVCVLFGVVSVLMEFLVCSTSRFVSGALVLFVRPAPFLASRSTRARVLQSSILNFLSVHRLPACPCRLVLWFSVRSGAVKFRFDLFVSNARIGFSCCV